VHVQNQNYSLDLIVGHTQNLFKGPNLIVDSLSVFLFQLSSSLQFKSPIALVFCSKLCFVAVLYN
jgi:hypothetical protein